MSAGIYTKLVKEEHASVSVDSTANKFQRHRELVIEIANKEHSFAFLKFVDEQFSWYNVPVGRVSTRKSNESSNQDTLLVPVIPRCYAGVDLNPDKATVPRENGYLYVYKGDYLWREFIVLADGVFKEINLHKYQGQDIRHATVEKDTRILLPYKVKGKKEVISMCFSEIQWSWARINSMGGMSENDIRFDHEVNTKLASDIGISKQQATKNRTERMQEIDLSGYSDGFTVRASQENKARIENVDDNHSNLYHLNLHKKSQAPVVYLHDPLGIAMRNVQTYYAALTELTTEIDKAKNTTYFKSAVMSHHAFYNKDLWESSKRRHGRNTYTTYSHTGDGPDLLRTAAGEMDQLLLRKILRVANRKKIRKQIRDIKTIHVEWLEGKFKGKQLQSSHSDLVTVNAALLDYAELPAPAYIAFWAALHGLIHFIGIDPSSVDGGLDLKKDLDGVKREDDIGVKYLNGLLQETHPLHKAAFPSKQQIDEYSEKYSYEGKQPESANGTGAFRPAAFAACMVRKFSQRDEWKNYSDVIKVAEKIVTDLVNIYKKQWEQAMTGKLQINATVLIRLIKAANLEDLKGFRLLKKGSPLNGAVVMSGNVSVFEHLRVLQQQSQIVKEEKKGYVKVVDPNSKEPIGYMDPHQLPNNKGAPSYISKGIWSGLFIKKIQGVIQTRTNLLVVSAESRYALNWSNFSPSAENMSMSKTKSGIQFAGKVLPVGVAVMEVFNLHSVVSSLSYNSSTKRKMAELIASGVGLAHASTVAAIALSNEDVIANLFKRTSGRMGGLLDIVSGKKIYAPAASKAGEFMIKGKIRIAGKLMPFLAVVGAGLAGAGAMFAGWDAISAFRADDTDAGVAYSVAMLAMVGQVAAILLEGSVIFLGMGPVGWAFLIIGIIAGVLAWLFTDTDLEKWAKLGPFGKGNKGRPDPNGVYKNANEHKIHEAFMSLLQSPTVKVSYDKSTSSNQVVVEVIAPGFSVGKGSLDIRATMISNRTPTMREITYAYSHQNTSHHDASKVRVSDQNEMKCIKMSTLQDPDNPARIIGMQYFYDNPRDKIHPNDNGGYSYGVRARSRHTTEEGYVIPTDPHNDNSVADHPTIINEKVNGWAYSKVFKC